MALTASTWLRGVPATEMSSVLDVSLFRHVDSRPSTRRLAPSRALSTQTVLPGPVCLLRRYTLADDGRYVTVILEMSGVTMPALTIGHLFWVKRPLVMRLDSGATYDGVEALPAVLAVLWVEGWVCYLRNSYLGRWVVYSTRRLWYKIGTIAWPTIVP